MASYGFNPGAGIEQVAALGNQNRVAAESERRQRKEMLSDEDRQQKASDLIEARHNTLANLPSIKGLYGEDSPQYKSALQTITQSQYDLRQLYHPINDPTALQKDWHWLLEKVHGIKQPKGMDEVSSDGSSDQAGPQNTPAAAEKPTGQEGQSATPPPAAAASAAPLTWKNRGQWQSPAELKQKAAAMQLAQQQTNRFAAGIGLTPQEQAISNYQTNEVVQQKKIEDALATAKRLGFSDNQIDELKQQLVGLKNVAPKPLTGAAGVPYKGADGLYYQNLANPDGSVGRRLMPPDWKPNTKAVRGTLVNTKSNGWIQTWVDPYNPSKVIGFQKVTPGSRYTGSTSTSSSTDPFGLTTSTSRATTPTSGSTPVDVRSSGMQQLPENYNGEEIPESPTSPSTGQAPQGDSGSPNKNTSPQVAPPTSVRTPQTSSPSARPQVGATPAQLKTQVPAPPPNATGSLPLDSTGHIPANAPYNPQLVEAANQLLDGMDIEKLTIPQKAREAASALARKYGWGGQGMFNPQQKLEIREASTFLNDAIKSPALDVLNSRISREKIIAALNNSEGHAGWTDAFIARNFNLNPQEAEFLRMYRQLTGTISGLASLTRPGRPTEAGIKRLMFELPNPNESHSASDAKSRLQRLIKEIDIATQKGSAEDLFNPAGSGSTVKSGGALDQYMQSKGLPPIK